MNGDVDNDYGTYCILGLPIDRSGNNAIVDNISSINSSSFILENMTSRPVGIAILNSSSHSGSSIVVHLHHHRPHPSYQNNRDLTH